MDFRTYLKTRRLDAIDVWREAGVAASYGSEVVNDKRQPSYRFMDAVERATGGLVQPNDWFPQTRRRRRKQPPIPFKEYLRETGKNAIDVWREAGITPSFGSEVVNGNKRPSYKFMAAVDKATFGRVDPNTWFPSVWRRIRASEGRGGKGEPGTSHC